MNTDPLDRLLVSWQPEVAVAPDFRAGVWRRVAVAGVQAVPGARWSSRWAAAAAAMLVAGIAAGLVTRPDTTAAERADYLVGINPLVMSHER